MSLTSPCVRLIALHPQVLFSAPTISCRYSAMLSYRQAPPADSAPLPLLLVHVRLFPISDLYAITHAHISQLEVEDHPRITRRIKVLVAGVVGAGSTTSSSCSLSNHRSVVFLMQSILSSDAYMLLSNTS